MNKVADAHPPDPNGILNEIEVKQLDRGWGEQIRVIIRTIALAICSFLTIQEYCKSHDLIAAVLAGLTLLLLSCPSRTFPKLLELLRAMYRSTPGHR